MANSDNTVRLGLTPKFIDIKNAIEMLNISSDTSNFLVKKEQISDKYFRYSPPVNAFRVDCAEGQGEFRIEHAGSIQILLSVGASGLLTNQSEKSKISSGDILAIPASSSSYLMQLTEGKVFIAYCP